MNIGWFNKDSVNGTTEVLGSVNQYQAPIDVLIDIRVSTTKTIIFINSKKWCVWETPNLLRHRRVDGLRQAITSVNRRSKAFKSEILSLELGLDKVSMYCLHNRRKVQLHLPSHADGSNDILSEILLICTKSKPINLLKFLVTTNQINFALLYKWWFVKIIPRI